jgi:hypothetical protein
VVAAAELVVVLEVVEVELDLLEVAVVHAGAEAVYEDAYSPNKSLTTS